MCVPLCVVRMVPTQEGPPCGQTEGRGLLSTVKGLQLQLGRQVIQCSAYVTGKRGIKLYCTYTVHILYIVAAYILTFTYH